MGKGRDCAIGSFILYISLKAIRKRIAFFFGRSHERQVDVVSRSVWKLFLRENCQGAAGEGWKQREQNRKNVC